MKKLLGVLMALVMLAPAVWAKDQDEDAEERITRVAVFDVGAVDNELKTTAEKVAPLLRAALTSNPDLELVEREALTSIMNEQGLSVTGIVDENEAVKVAQLAGADVLVTGRIFELDEELVYSSKIIGVETSRVFAKVVKGKLTDPLAPIVDNMAANVGKVIVAKKDKFFAAAKTEQNPLPEILAAIKGKKLPRVAVEVFERHVRSETIDPTVETELQGLLTEAGFELFDPKSRIMSDWADEYLKSGKIPRSMENVDVVIVGEAFSELGARLHGMVSCKGRIEIKAIDNRTGRILAVGRATHRALDVSEMVAAKSSLEQGTRKIAPVFVERLVDAWNKPADESKPAQDQPAEKKAEEKKPAEKKKDGK